ncbi:MAG: ABC transporter ATP-binding protein [Actinomycetes bacterium]|jgi:iron complex transport system ATP-binding protein
MNEPTMIQASGVAVSVHRHQILRDVDLSVPVGGWTCIIGPNGAGKTTALRVLVGAQAFSGLVRINGDPLDARGQRNRHCAYVAQRPAAPAGMRVREYVELGRFPHDNSRGSRGSNRAVVDDALEQLELESLQYRMLTSLSGGEVQRAAIARAISQQAPVLVLDEPTSALDLHRQPAILNVIDRQRTEHGTTVLCTMHDITLAAMYARDFVVMNHGRVVDQGTAAQVFAGEHLARAFNDNIEIFAGPDGTPIVLPRR